MMLFHSRIRTRHLGDGSRGSGERAPTASATALCRPLGGGQKGQKLREGSEDQNGKRLSRRLESRWPTENPKILLGFQIFSPRSVSVSALALSDKLPQVNVVLGERLELVRLNLLSFLVGNSSYYFKYILIFHISTQNSNCYN